MSKVLLVEDNAHKRDRVLAYLSDTHPGDEVRVESSYSAAIRALAEEDFDLAILDMSLPTFDKSKSESGGRFRTFGGREIARRIAKKDPKARVIFLTQYESFSDGEHSMTLDELSDLLKSELALPLVSIIYFDPTKSEWKHQLDEALRE